MLQVLIRSVSARSNEYPHVFIEKQEKSSKNYHQILLINNFSGRFGYRCFIFESGGPEGFELVLYKNSE